MLKSLTNLKCVFSLPFLKPKKVFDCCIDGSMAIKPVNSTVDKCCDYLLETYIEKEELFLPNIWANEGLEKQGVVTGFSH